MNDNGSVFADLTPDLVLSAVENASGQHLTGLLTPFPSYINRVYEIESEEGERLVVKFYRPGRWTKDALLEEHSFMADCAERDIPVVTPLGFQSGETLAEYEGFFFALFPKKSGRLFELNSDEDYIRAGSLIGRIHSAGRKRSAFSRTTLDPSVSTKQHVKELLQGDIIPDNLKGEFRKTADVILETIVPFFRDVRIQRIHGDCHLGNILARPEGDGRERLMIIDFDDMAVGPAVHDLWLLLPGSYSESKNEFSLLIEGYEQFMPFDYSTVALIEPLRAMRIIYFLAWCARQTGDYQFRNNFPDWGTPKFWEEEIRDLINQVEEIQGS